MGHVAVVFSTGAHKHPQAIVIFISKLKTASFPKNQNIMLSLGFPNLEFVPTIRSVCGLVLGWKPTTKIQVVVNTWNINIFVLSLSWQLTKVYGPTISILTAQFRDFLTAMENAWSDSWCILSDFNSLLNQNEKMGGSLVSQSSSSRFRGFIQSRGLIDIGFSGSPYTWNNKQSGSANI